jgi:two-component system OmpR family sensor kinase
VWVERPVRGIDGTARMLAGPVRAGSDVILVVAGQSLGDRDEALRDLLASFLIGGPAAVIVASAVGYGLARTGLSPIEAIRRTAAEVSSADDGRRLPVPGARDEVHRLAVTLNEMIERLERSFERELRFVADASHELRTPIAVVKTELEAALLFGDCGPQAGESLRAAIDECDGLAQLAEDLLVIARTSEAGLPLAKEPVAIRILLEDVRHRFIDRAHRHGREINVDLAEDRDVVADPVRMRQALANLVDNALRHGAGDITLTGVLDTTAVHLGVRDEGHGFERDIAGRAFERFARGDRARTRGGAGLGLSIVKTLAEAHGGTVSILPGAPTTVRIAFPH